MARTHGSRLDALEQTAMRFILKSEMLERENAALLQTIEKLKARLERLEAQAAGPSWRDVNWRMGALS